MGGRTQCGWDCKPAIDFCELPSSSSRVGLMRRGGCSTVLSASVMSLVKGPDGEKPIEDWWEDDHM